MNGSSSSTTISRSTEAANWRISCFGQRPGHAQVQDRGRREDLFGILVGDAGGDDPQRAVAGLDAVEGEGLGEFGDARACAARSPGGASWHCPGIMTYLAGLRGNLSRRIHGGGSTRSPSSTALVEWQMRVVMRSSTGVSKRSLSPKAAIIRSLASWLSRWLQAGDAGELGEGAVVLLVLAGVHARVVGGDDHQARPRRRSWRRT